MGSVFAQSDPDCAFYPLANGDQWQYKITLIVNNSTVDTVYYEIKYVLGDTLMPNGYTYKKVREENLYSANAGDIVIRYILVDSVSANVYEYIEDNANKGELIDSLKCQQGDTFGFGYRCENTGIDSILEYETEYKDISQTAPDISNQHTLAKDIGISYQNHDITQEWGGYKKFELVYAFVGGKIFGGFVNSIPVDKRKPSDFVLFQNYPNPFNPATTFKYQIPAAGMVELSIFNMAGQKIATLINGPQTAGTHKIKWNAASFPSGLYLYRLKTNGSIRIKKLLFIK